MAAPASPAPHQRRSAPHAPRRKRSKRPSFVDLRVLYPRRRLVFDREVQVLDREEEPEFQATASPDNHEIIDECSICKEPIEAKDAINMTCGDVFHLDCINLWRRVSDHHPPATCPNCRRQLKQIKSLHRIIQRYQRVLSNVQHNMERELRDVVDLTKE